MNGLLSIGMAICFFSLVMTAAALLATRDTRRTVLVLVLLGLLAAAVKIFLFQQAPQWHLLNPDSITYDLNAKAFAEHWRGNAVEGQKYHLRGLLASHAAGIHGSEWLPDDKLTYGGVIESSEWLFTAYIAFWYWLGDATQGLAVWSNALWAAFFPAAAFGIARTLCASQRVALAAAILALLDPSAGVNASWLLKDTFAGFLSVAALWALLAHLRDGGKTRFVLATLALGGLGGARFVGFLALVIAAVLVSVWLLFKNTKSRSRGLAIIGIVFFAWLINGVLVQAPLLNLTGGHALETIGALAAPAITVSQGIDVLRSNQGDASADESVLSWKDTLAKKPVYAIMRSASRTLFAPYPWVAISPGLNWVSFSELYYPGVVLWILCLPGLFAALVRGLKQSDPGFWLVTLFLAALLAAYTIWLGEWSTRQRVFALPVFFSLAAIGWSGLLVSVSRVRSAASQDYNS